MTTACQPRGPRRPRGHDTVSEAGGREAEAKEPSKAKGRRQTRTDTGRSKTRVTTACQPHGRRRPRGRGTVSEESKARGEARQQGDKASRADQTAIEGMDATATNSSRARMSATGVAVAQLL